MKRYDLLMVEEKAFIAVVMTDNSVVKNKLVRMADQVSDPQLQMLSTVLNNVFRGRVPGGDGRDPGQDGDPRRRRPPLS